MVARPPHHCIIVAWYFDRFGRHSPCAIYLYFILKNYDQEQSAGNDAGIGVGPHGLLPHY